MKANSSQKKLFDKVKSIPAILRNDSQLDFKNEDDVDQKVYDEFKTKGTKIWCKFMQIKEPPKTQYLNTELSKVMDNTERYTLKTKSDEKLDTI